MPSFVVLILFAVVAPFFSVLQAEDLPVWSEERGSWQYRVTSPHITGTNLVEVLLPKIYDRSKKYRTLYILPVEPKEEHKYGDPILSVKKFDAQNLYNLIIIRPTFDIVPWFGNHSTNPQCHQEDYLLQTVVPLIERDYSTLGSSEGRLLLGFSKSGWGAMTLILRNPKVFGYAASWDAPLMFTENQFGIWGTDANYGTAKNMADYVPSVLLKKNAGSFSEKSRLVITGKQLFGTFTDKKRFPYDGPSHTETFHELAIKLGIKHIYDADIKKGHSFNPGWMEPVLSHLNSISTVKNRK